MHHEMQHKNRPADNIGRAMYFIQTASSVENYGDPDCVLAFENGLTYQLFCGRTAYSIRL